MCTFVLNELIQICRRSVYVILHEESERRGGARERGPFLPATPIGGRGDLLSNARGERGDKKAARNPSAETE